MKEPAEIDITEVTIEVTGEQSSGNAAGAPTSVELDIEAASAPAPDPPTPQEGP
jgi:hypothetical protein